MTYGAKEKNMRRVIDVAGDVLLLCGVVGFLLGYAAPIVAIILAVVGWWL